MGLCRIGRYRLREAVIKSAQTKEPEVKEGDPRPRNQSSSVWRARAFASVSPMWLFLKHPATLRNSAIRIHK